MNEKPKTSPKLHTAVVVGELVLASVTLALKVAGLFHDRVKV